MTSPHQPARPITTDDLSQGFTRAFTESAQTAALTTEVAGVRGELSALNVDRRKEQATKLRGRLAAHRRARVASARARVAAAVTASAAFNPAAPSAPRPKPRATAAGDDRKTSGTGTAKPAAATARKTSGRPAVATSARRTAIPSAGSATATRRVVPAPRRLPPRR